MANFGARLAGLSRPFHSASLRSNSLGGGVLSARPSPVNPALIQSRRWTVARSFSTKGSTDNGDKSTTTPSQFMYEEMKIDEKDKHEKSAFASPGPIYTPPVAATVEGALDDGSIIELALPSVAPIHLRLPEDQPSDSEVLEWYKKEGDLVESGESICEIDTDIFSYDFSSPSTGYLAKIIAPAGTKGLASEAAIAWLAEEKDQITDVAKMADDKYGAVIAAAKAAKKQRKKDEKAEAAAAAEKNEATDAAEQDAHLTAAAAAIGADVVSGDHIANLNYSQHVEPKATPENEETHQQQQDGDEYEDDDEDEDEDVVVSFLKGVDPDLAKYATAFHSDGFDNLSSILTLTDDDLGTLGVRKGHRRLILAEIEGLKQDEADELERELREGEKLKERV